jgi:hypothetical protein
MGGAKSTRADGSGISQAVLRFLGGVPGEEEPDVEVLEARRVSRSPEFARDILRSEGGGDPGAAFELKEGT